MINASVTGLCIYRALYHYFIYLFFETESLCRSGWSALALSQLTGASASQVQVILLPQPPEWLGLQARATTPS